ncbi:hypothetical protein V2J09_020948 [Rumex salicifolius]
MEPQVTNCERRGRKRRRKFEKNAPDVDEPGRQPKKRAIEIRGMALVGRFVLKDFDENGVFLGKISSYDSGLYRVEYEDGDCEDLDSGEVLQYLIAEEHFDDELLARRKKLEKFLEKNRVKADLSKKVGVKNANPEVNVGEILKPNGLPDRTEADNDEDSYSNSSEYAEDLDLQQKNQAPTVPPPELPPSSGTIGLPEDCVPYLFSIYGFLRSFSVILFLSPFTLDDLVGCLNCSVPNMLLDAIHVALLRKVRQRLETLSSDGSELALECLRCIDWSLLDLLTWPVYIVHYFRVMKDTKEPEWKGFYSDVLDKDYCTLKAGRKLKVLQILCDDALENESLRAEIDTREESEVGLTYDMDPDFPLESGPMRVHHGSRISSSKHREATVGSSNISSAAHGASSRNMNTADDEDKNSDECRLCGMDGTLLCCDGCPSAYHSRCIGVSKMFIPEGPWFCPECTISRIGPTVTVGTSLKGAEVFGSDPYGQVFMGTCNHLVVLRVTLDAVPFARYYDHTDIPNVLRALHSCADHEVLYSGISQSMIKYWEIPQDVLPLQTVQASIELSPKKEEAAIPSVLHSSAENGSIEYRGNEGTMENKLMLSSENPLRLSGLSENPMGSSANQTEVASMSSNFDAKLKDECPNAAIHGISDNKIGGVNLNDSSKNTSALSNNNSSGGNKNGISLRIKFSLKKEASIGAGRNDQTRASCPQMGSSFKPHAYMNNYIHGEFAASAAAAYLAVFSSEENRTESRPLDNPRKTKAFSSVAVRFFWPTTEKKLFEVPRERCGWCLSCQGSITSKKACLLNAAALNATRFATKIISGLRLSKNVENSLYSIAMYTLYLEESLRGLLVGPFQSAIYRLQWRKQVELCSSCSEIKARLLELEGNLRTISLSGDWTKLVDDWDVKPLNIQTTAISSIQKRGPGRPSNSQTNAASSIQKRGPGRPPKKHIFTAEVAPDDSGENSNDYIWWRGRKQSKLVTQKGILPHAMLKKAARLGGKTKITGLHYTDISDIPKRSRQLVWRAAVERSKNASHLAIQVRHLDHHIRWSDLVRPEQAPQDLKGQETESSAFRNAFICDKRVADNKVMFGVVFGHQKHLPSRLMKSIIEKEETPDGKEKYWFLETRIPLYLIREYEQQQQLQLLQTENAVLPLDNVELHSLSALQKKQLKDSRKKIFLYLVRKRDNMGYCHRECTMSSAVQGNEDIGYIITCKSCVHAKTIAQNKNVESPTSPLALQGQDYQNGVSAAKSAKQKHSGKQLLPVGASDGLSNVSGLSTTAKRGKKKHNGKQKLPIGTPESVAGVKVLSVSKKRKKSHCGKKLPHESSSGIKQRSVDSNLNSYVKKKLCSLGLIWKKNKKNEPEDNGIEFRHKNILMKGNPQNMDVSEVQCRSCQKQYDPSFTIRQPTCPLREKTDGDNGKFFEQGDGLDTFSCSMSEQAESSIPTTPVTPIEDDVYIELDDPLLSSVDVEDNPELTPELNIKWETPIMGPQKLPVRRQHDDNPDLIPELNIEWDTHSTAGPQKLPVRRQNENIPELTPELNIEWDTPPVSAPQKLPVRRQNDNSPELNMEWDGPSMGPQKLPVRRQNISEPVDNLLVSPQAEWDASTGAEGGMQFDYDQFNFEVPEFEPQTYFSFTELLAADDTSQPTANPSENTTDAWENFAGETSQSGYMDEFQIEEGPPSNDLMEPAINIQCNSCLHTEPTPDLFCQNCGIHIHSHCSPWEEPPQEESWKCGNCRAWRSSVSFLVLVSSVALSSIAISSFSNRSHRQPHGFSSTEEEQDLSIFVSLLHVMFLSSSPVDLRRAFS